MEDNKLTVFADLNCPFCFTLHERLLALGYLNQVDWRCIEHAPHIKYDINDLHAHSELTQEVARVREMAPEINIMIPAGRPNSHRAIELTTEALAVDPDKAIALRTLIYRSLWVDGEDFSQPELLDSLAAKVELPVLNVGQETRETMSRWQQEWEHGSYSRHIPAVAAKNGPRILGLPSPELIELFLAGAPQDKLEEGAFCYLKPKEKVLIATADTNALELLANALQPAYHIEFAQYGGAVSDTCLSDQPPDIVLMDVALEDPKGFQTCLQLKEHDSSRNIPVILFASDPDVSLEVMAFDVGASDYIKVPCAREVLKARVRVLLRFKRTNDLLEQYSRLDCLTEVPNRREFDRVLEKEWLRAKRTGKPLSLILIDVDYFKKYNDNYGHMEGDQCLRQVANVIERSIRRPHDIVARYGGEEFVVILPETDKEGMLRVANALKSKLARLALPHDNSLVSKYVTVSQGGATVIPTGHVNPKQLIDTADSALYEAKDAGRDRFVFKNLSLEN